MKKIFISSTFKDMQIERDAIRDIASPSINKLAHKYGDQIDFCDLRWGIDTKNLESFEKSTKVIDVCFEEIERSDNVFILLLGDRYGSIPDPNIISYVVNKYDLDSTDVNRSITTMEYEYALKNKERIVLCYYRQTSGSGIPEMYLSDIGVQLERLEKFRDSVEKNTRVKMIPYTMKFVDGKPVDDDVREFCDRIVDDLEEIYQKEWSEVEKLSQFAKEQRRQWAFINDKKRLFYARENDLEKCVDLIEKEDNQVVVCKGKMGYGKSTLFSGIADHFRTRGIDVLPFIGGLTDESDDAIDILKNIIRFLQEEVNDISELSSNDVSALQNELVSLSNRFAQNDRHLIIMIDALDQIDCFSGFGKLPFIPKGINKNIKFFMTCVNDYLVNADETYLLHGLSIDDKNKTIAGICRSIGRELNEEVVDSIIKRNQSDNPLYISFLIQRLIMMGQDDFEWIRKDRDNRNITSRQISIIESCTDNLDELGADNFIEIGKRINPFVSKVALEGIAESRYGLRISDISCICGNKWNYLDFSRLIHYFNDFFVIRSDGRYDYNHRCIREGIQRRIDKEGRSKEVNSILLQHLDTLEEADEVRISEIGYHIVKADDRDYMLKYLNKYALSGQTQLMIEFARSIKPLMYKQGGVWIKEYTESLISEDQYTASLWFVSYYLNGQFKDSLEDAYIILPVLEAAEKVLDVHKENMSDKNRDLFSDRILGTISHLSHFMDKNDDSIIYAKKRLDDAKRLLNWRDDPNEKYKLYLEYYDYIVIAKSSQDKEVLWNTIEVAEQGLNMMDAEAWKVYDAHESIVPYIDCIGEMYHHLDNIDKSYELYKKGLELRQRHYELHPSIDNKISVCGGRDNVSRMEVIRGRYSKAYELYKENIEIYDSIGDMIQYYRDKSGEESTMHQYISFVGMSYIDGAQVARILYFVSKSSQILNNMIVWMIKAVNYFMYSYHISGWNEEKRNLKDALEFTQSVIKTTPKGQYKNIKINYFSWMKMADQWVYEKPSEENQLLYLKILKILIGMLEHFSGGDFSEEAKKFILEYGLKNINQFNESEREEIRRMYNFFLVQESRIKKAGEENKQEKENELTVEVLSALKSKLKYTSLTIGDKVGDLLNNAVLEYARGIDRKSVIAIEEKIHKNLFKKELRGIIFAKRDLWSSYIPDNPRLPYKDIKEIGLYGDEVKLLLKSGKSIIVDFGDSNDKVVAIIQAVIGDRQ